MSKNHFRRRLNCCPPGTTFSDVKKSLSKAIKLLPTWHNIFWCQKITFERTNFFEYRLILREMADLFEVVHYLELDWTTYYIIHTYLAMTRTKISDKFLTITNAFWVQEWSVTTLDWAFTTWSMIWKLSTAEVHCLAPHRTIFAKQKFRKCQ